MQHKTINSLTLLIYLLYVQIYKLFFIYTAIFEKYISK